MVKKEQNTLRVERISKVWQPDAKICTLDKTFVIPVFGNNTYQKVGKAILSKDLNVPIGEDTASLAHTAYCSEMKDESELRNVRDVVERQYLWTFNQNLWTDKGVYIVNDFKVNGLNEQLNPNDLDEILKGGKELSWGGIRFSPDGNVRFAPIESYSFGEHTPEELAEQGDVIARHSVEGAKMLGEVTSQMTKELARTYGVNVSEGEEPVQRLSGLFSYNGPLHVDGDIWNDNIDGSAFGVVKDKQGK